MTAAYVCTALLFLAIIFLAILVGSILDAKRIWTATLVAILVALAWPIILLAVARGGFAKWRCERTAREAYRKMKARMDA